MKLSKSLYIYVESLFKALIRYKVLGVENVKSSGRDLVNKEQHNCFQIALNLLSMMNLPVVSNTIPLNESLLFN